MVTPETRYLILGDFNNTLGNTGVPLDSGTVSIEPLSPPDLDLVNRELPDTNVWQFARPILEATNGDALLKSTPLDIWRKQAPFLDLDGKTLDRIEQDLTQTEQEDSKAPWFIKLGWKAQAFSHRINHISPYQIKTREYQAIKKIRELGGEFSLVTALLEHSESDLVAHLSDPNQHNSPLQNGEATVWEVMQGETVPLWMRRGHDISTKTMNRYKSLVYKTNLVYAEGVNIENHHRGLNKRLLVTGWDDDIFFVLTAVAIFNRVYGLKMHMPQSFAEVMRQIDPEDLESYARWIGRSVWDIFTDTNPQDESTEKRFGNDPLITCSSGPAQIAHQLLSA